MREGDVEESTEMRKIDWEGKIQDEMQPRGKLL